MSRIFGIKIPRWLQYIEQGVDMGKLFEGLKKGMQEIIAHKEGQLTLKSEFIEIPELPKELKLKTAKANSHTTKTC